MADPKVILTNEGGPNKASELPASLPLTGDAPGSLFDGPPPTIRSSDDEIARFKAYVDDVLANAAVGAEQVLVTAGLDQEQATITAGDLTGATFSFDTFVRGLNR